jgi:two-component system response regulator AtoC
MAKIDPPSVQDAGLKEQITAAMSALEREIILRALARTGNNVSQAARLLKISRKGLQLKIKKLRLREPDTDATPGASPVAGSPGELA